MSGDREPAALLRRLLEGVIGDAGVDVLDDVTTDDVTFEAVTGEAFEGRETIKEVVEESMAAYDSFDLEIEWTVAEDDRVVASTRTTAKSRRGILGMPPPEATRTIDTVFDARLEDGRIAYLRQVLDTRQMMPVAVRRGRGAVLEQMRDAVVVLDERRRVVDANAAALELLGTEREAVLGKSAADALGLDSIDVASGSDPTTLERDDRIYEVRSSPIVAEAEDPVGYTLVARDVTERERRTRTLAEQRDELERLSDLNSVLRGVNQALVSARTRKEIERAVCDRLAESERFDAACVGDVRTWAGDADEWTVAGEHDPDGLSVAELDRSPVARSDGGASVRRTFEPTIDSSAADVAAAGESDEDAADVGGEPAETWVVVPLLYGSTVYGGLGLCTDRESVGDRERAVLLELGETIGHAVNALETRRLLSADATVALEFRSTDDADPLVAATANHDGALELDGLVPAGEGRTVVYVRVDSDEPAAVAESLASVADGSVRTVREEGGWILEWTLTGDVPLRSFVESGANVQEARAAEGTVTYRIEVASDADVRSLVDRVRRRFPDVRLHSKSERSEPASVTDAAPLSDDADLTSRQREALEAAYRSGYFSWPRDSTAEVIADSLDVAPSTLHSHLRKAEGAVVGAFLEDESV